MSQGKEHYAVCLSQRTISGQMGQPPMQACRYSHSGQLRLKCSLNSSKTGLSQAS